MVLPSCHPFRETQMRQTFFAVQAAWVLALSIGAIARGQTLEPADPDVLRQKPITTIKSPAGDLLRQWWKDGSAAGNIGDYYDNRDGDHSPLSLGLYPQLLAVKYSPDDIKFKRHWAAQSVIHPAVVFGNSSTSAPPTLGGSNPRSYYCSARGLGFLAQQYIRNNIYIYPEHRDHDAGHNGKGDGFGDLYPTNTPYLLISQGSSGSDQPFMRAIPLTLAAFRPEVKKKLTETGTLMPTLQMILRSTYNLVKDPKEYLAGRAHPTVFEGSLIDELAMVKLAHSMEIKALPPMVQLKVIEEDKAVAGVDYFTDGPSEALADTPAVIARIHRSKDRQRRLVVSAEGSFDVNKAPLTFTWVVLRGDPKRIEIKPRNKESSVAEITVAYHERRPIAPDSSLESSRVDIGVFVHNGAYYSAPGFVTIASLDDEGRVYDAKGRIREIYYGMGEADFRIKDWENVLAVLSQQEAAAKLLGLDGDRRKLVAQTLADYRTASAALRTAQAKVKEAEAREQKASKEEKEERRKEAEAARKERGVAEQAVNAVLGTPRPSLGTSWRAYVETACRNLCRADFWAKHAAILKTLKADPSPAHKEQLSKFLEKAVRLGFVEEELPEFIPATASPPGFRELVTNHIRWMGLSHTVFPGGTEVSFLPNFVDQRLTAPREWRDVYHYDKAGECIGWTRFHPDRGKEVFNYEGLLVVENDDLGCCKKARTVRYTRKAAKGFPNPNPLQMEPGDQWVHYTFTGPDDRRGKRSGSEPAK